jgi:hypothetical protein
MFVYGIFFNSIFRVHLLTRQDLNNIVNQYALDNTKLHKNDATSVEIWVKTMPSNVVRFFKPQGILMDEYPFFNKEDFCLIIMNDSQLHMLNEHGNDCLCIDGTHGLNNYDFDLYTVMVLDDLRQGFPCSFMFTNRKDSLIFQHFFRIIKTVLGTRTMSPKTFMSDMEDTFFNAWSTVMGPVTHRLYCSWHVLRAWNSNLSKINNPEKKIAVYKNIKTLLYETDKVTFHAMLDGLMADLHGDTETVSFGKYFQKYKMNYANWSYSYRINSGINTNMHLENMHRVLKHIYFRGTKVNRLDKAIHGLMTFIRDKLFDQLISSHRGKVTSKITNIRLRHNNSLALTLESIVKEGDDWLIQSSSTLDIFRVSKSNISNCSCLLKCESCGICYHYYICTCTDFAIKWNMCKHVHLLCRYLNTPAMETENVHSNIDIDNVESTIDVESTSSVSNVETKADLFRLIQNEITPEVNNTSSDLSDERLMNIFKHCIELGKSNGALEV